jgi:D,D-heptose 1,7-bisphosphate phosphatase
VGEIRAVLLDRDGTINLDTGHLHRIEDFELLPGSLEALKLFMGKDIKIYVVTNQAGIAKGLYTEEDFRAFTAEMLGGFRSRGVVITDVLYCPHHPEGSVPGYATECLCRKPNTGLLEEALEREGLTPEQAALVGDKNSDIEAGCRLGMTTYLVLTGYGREQQHETKATYVVNDLLAAAVHVSGARRGEDYRTRAVDAIILAGGLGTRLRGVVGDVPKVLAAVRGRPFLDLILETLSRCPFMGRVVIATGYMAERIHHRYGSGHPYPFDITFSEEKKLLGTGGAIKKALKHTMTDTVLALNGDSYVDVNLVDLYASHKARKAAMTMVLKAADDAGQFGTVKVDTSMRITEFEEKKGTAAEAIINAGVYVFHRDLFDGVPDGVPLSLERDLLPGFLHRGVYGYVSSGKFIDIGTPKSYRMADTYLGGAQSE